MKIRKTSSFEKMLLIVGLLILVIGYMLISKTYVVEGSQLSYGFLKQDMNTILIQTELALNTIGLANL